MKKRISLILACVMLLGILTAALPISVFAADEEARVGSTSYATLAEAIANVGENGEVVLLKNVTLTSAISIPQGKKFTLSGGSYTLTCGANNLFEISNTGIELTVKDGTFVSTGTGVMICITKSGTNAKIVIENGTFTNSAVNSHYDGTVVRMDSDCDVTVKNGTFRFENGRIIAASNDDARTDAVLTIEGGDFQNTFGRMFDIKGLKLTISGGRFAANIAKHGAARAMLQFSEGCEVEISGGSFILEDSRNHANQTLLEVFNNVSLKISGGYFYGTDIADMLYMRGTGATVTITGGWFEKNPSNANTRRFFELGGNNMTIYEGYFAHYGDSPLIHDSKCSATLTIYGGTFASKGTSPIARGGEINDNAVFNIYGGQFMKLDARDGGNYVFAHAKLNSGMGTYFVTTRGCAWPMGVSTHAGELIKTISGSSLYAYSYKTFPAVQEGASVRLIAEQSGLRFTSDISKEILDYVKDKKDNGTTVSYGTVIAPTDYLTGLNSFTMEALKGAGKTYLDIVAKDGITYNTEGGVTIRAAIVDILEGNYTRDFSAVSYVKYTVNGQEVYIYSAFDMEKNTRNIAEVAQAAIDSGDYDSDAAALAILNSYIQK